MFTYFINTWKKDYNILTMKIRELWTDRGLQTEWMRQPSSLPYIALHPGLCHVITGLLRIGQILNLARDDVTNSWLLIRLRSPWDFWPQSHDLTLASQLRQLQWGNDALHQGGNDALHQGGMRSVLQPYFVVNLFVIYTGDPRRDDGERPAIWSWFSLVGSHVGDYDLHFCFSTIYF